MKSFTYVNCSSIVGVFIVFSIFVQGQTVINGGPVSGVWTILGSPYEVMGDIEIPAGSTLIMEAGVTVKIYSELSIKVYGKLLAEGTVDDSVFFMPIAEYWKGLQILNSPDTINIKYCSFKNFKNRINIGSAIKGGVLYGLNSHLLISNTILSNNQAVSSSNINWAMGGAICFENCQGFLLNSYLLNNSIQNSSSYTQGGFLGRGGALYLAGCNYIIQGNQIVQNSIELISDMDGTSISEANGGGIYVEGNNVWINNNIIQGNTCISYALGSGISWLEPGSGDAFSLGGGIFGGKMKNNIIINNYCQSEGIGGGGSGVGGYGMAVSKGGGIYNAIVIDNNLIKNNHCHATADGSDNANAESSGGGVKGGFLNNNTIYANNIQAYVGITGSIDLSGAGVNSCTVENSIIYNNSGSDQISNSSVIFSCVQGGFPGQGNISDDPLFISGPQGNYYLSQYPCQLQESPCVNSGDTSSSLIFGTTRTDEYPDNEIVDMGFHYLLYSPAVFADFYSDKNCGFSPLDVHFFNNNVIYQVDSIAYEWDFEDDGIIDSYIVDPLFSYTESGVYNVKLKIIGYSNDTIIVDSIIKENFLTVSDEFNTTLDFICDKNYGEYPLEVKFNDNSIIEPCGIINSWQWDFENDGIVDSFEKDPIWTYDEVGIYTVKLSVSDTVLGISDSVSKESIIIVCNLLPGFYAEPLSGYNPLSVSFYDTSQVINSEIWTWLWDFENDGIFDLLEQNPTWLYDEPGIYSVKLRITDTSGQISNSIVKEDYIEVLTVGIEREYENQSIYLFTAYPNPFNKKVFITYQSDIEDVVSIQLFDNMFKNVAELSTNEQINIGKNILSCEIDSEIKNGLYYFVLRTSFDEVFVKKCIKVD